MKDADAELKLLARRKTLHPIRLRTVSWESSESINTILLEM